MLTGAVPSIDNLPDSVQILTSEAVNNNIFIIAYSDDNTMDTLSLTLEAIDPVTSVFNVNTTDGKPVFSFYLPREALLGYQQSITKSDHYLKLKNIKKIIMYR